MSHSSGEALSFVDPQRVRIFYDRYDAENPKAVVQLAHGLGEHAGRYGALVAALNAAGYTVYANDHRGHGRTGVLQYQGNLAKLGKLGSGGLIATIADLEQFSELIRQEHPDLPLFLLGHSWGSLMAQIIINSKAEQYAGVILSGTAFRTPRNMYGGDLNHKHKHLGSTGYEWLSRDSAVAQAFADDPHCFTADVLKLFGVADGLKLYGKPNRSMAQVPILIMVGDDDSLGGRKSAELLAKSYRERARQQDVTLKVYPGARHEIFNETNADEIRADLLSWIEKRC